MKKIILAFGTRPEAIKMAPLVKMLKKDKKSFVTKVCVTAQHRQMLDGVLNLFKIKPEYDLNIMQEHQTLYHITAEALKRAEKVLLKEKPDLVLVHGDTTTTFAFTLAAFYQKIAVGHVEAGLRTYNKHHPFPEEANRVLTDALCAMHFAPTSNCKTALIKENIGKSSIYITGNTVIDALKMTISSSKKFTNQALAKLVKDLKKSDRVILITAHRRENHGKPFENVFNALKRVAAKYPNLHIVYPVHLSPKVQEPAKRILGKLKNVHLLPPLDYADLAQLMNLSYFVITDSGGIQEEAPSLGKPVLVLREVTERPEAVKSGTVKVIGTNEKKVYSEICHLLDNRSTFNKMARSTNPYGDGKATMRTIEAIKFHFGIKKKRPTDFK